MRKEQLVRALLKLARQNRAVAGGGKSRTKSAAVAATNRKSSARPKSNNKSAERRSTSAGRRNSGTQNPRVVRIIREENRKREQLKDLAQAMAANGKTGPARDRVVLIVRDPFWLQAYWEITRTTVQRASVALAENWHRAQPVIRLYEISDEGAAHATDQMVRDIPVHGGVKNWFIDVADPPKSYRIALGYASPNDKFYLIAKSNKVTTPIPSSSESVDHNWTDIAMNYQKYFALSGGYCDDKSNDDLREVFEQKLRRPMSTPMFAQIASGVHGAGNGFEFTVDAEMIIYGTADPHATVTLAGEPVKLCQDGSFEVRLSLPDRRQVLPIVACSRDGTEQRTTVVAIERNTKVMEPIRRDPEE